MYNISDIKYTTKDTSPQACSPNNITTTCRINEARQLNIFVYELQISFLINYAKPQPLIIRFRVTYKDGFGILQRHWRTFCREFVLCRFIICLITSNCRFQLMKFAGPEHMSSAMFPVFLFLVQYDKTLSPYPWICVCLCIVNPLINILRKNVLQSYVIHRKNNDNK